MNGINRIRHASLIQSAPGKNRARKSAYRKRGSRRQEMPHPENPAHPVNPRFRQTKMDRHSAYPHHTGKSVLAKRAYREFKSVLAKRAY